MDGVIKNHFIFDNSFLFYKMFLLYNHVLFVVSMFCKFLTMMTLLLNCMVALALLLNFVCRFLYVVKKIS
jgi:hypothetical protein